MTKTYTDGRRGGGRRKREHCKRCGGHVSQVGVLSRRGICRSCAIRAIIGSAQQIHARQGTYYDRWLSGMRGYVKQIDRGPR